MAESAGKDSKSSERHERDIPEMNLTNNYSPKKPILPDQSEMQKSMDKTKKELNKLKGFITKKYPFVKAIGLLPPQANKVFIEEEVGENIPKEEFEKLNKKVHLCVIIPEDKFKEINKIKTEIVKQIEGDKQDVWIYVKTEQDLWEYGMDSKFELLSAVAMSYPLHDKSGILKSLRVAEIHKSLVLQKFERYVVSYVVGGSIITGSAVKTSDLDCFIIINDTDVKRMPRLELKERLRGIIYQYIAEAHALAGVKEGNLIHVQVYLLTDFWESVKDANPVIFTFIRDGVPLYDRGTFMPWKALLKMGKLKPSPEAIDMFMSMGDKTTKRAKMALMDILVQDIYWGVITPSQALFMLHGLPPPTPKQILKDMRRIFVEKEKMLEPRYAAILENIVGKYKEFEHEKLKEIKGAEIDKMIKDSEDYLKRLKELREQIEKKAQGQTIEEVYNEVFDLLKAVTKKKTNAAIIEEFESMIKSGKFAPQSRKIIDNILSARADFKKGKTDLHKIDNVRRDSADLISSLVEFSQRKDLSDFEKGRMIVKYKQGEAEKAAEILVLDGKIFLFKDGGINKITNKVENSDMEEVSKAMEAQKGKKANVGADAFAALKKELGEFEIVF